MIHPEFPHTDDVLYLNHAAVAPWPQRTAQAVSQFAQENVTQGAQDYPRWMREEKQLRERLAWLIGGVSVDEIALLKNTSEGLSVIAQGIEWQAGDEVLISDEEFPSNRIPWQALASQGVSTREVALSETASPEAAIIAALTPQTRLVSLSAVQYGSGRRLDLKPIGEACRERGILFCVDAIQVLGAEPFSATDVCADFVVADGHKWMLGPEGLALFYCRNDVQGQLTLRQFGWHMIANPGDYTTKQWTVAPTAKRFECGSPNMLGIFALNASLSLLQEHGLATIRGDIQQRVAHMIEHLTARGAQILSPIAPEQRAGIVTFRLPQEPPALTYQRLKEGGVVCAERGGGVRLSPHFYTPVEVIDRALALL